MDELIKTQTAEEMVEAYTIASKEIEEAYLILSAAEKRLNAAFGDYSHYGRFETIPTNGSIRWNKDEPLELVDRIKDKLNRAAWQRIVEKIQIFPRMSTKRKEELVERLEKGELPDLTVENIFALLNHYLQEAETIQIELIKEAFDLLRPRRDEYKTNDKYVVGKKVILSWMVEQQWTGGGFRVGYYHQNDLVSLDRAFHILDGAPTPDAYDSPLTDAISTSPDGAGETEYFEFKCYKNRNLHITFKRLDLVERLNAVAGGANLHEDNAQQANMF